MPYKSNQTSAELEGLEQIWTNESQLFKAHQGSSTLQGLYG